MSIEMVLSLLSTDGCAPASKPQRVIPGGLGESALIGTLHARTLHVILRPRRRRTRTHKWSTAKCSVYQVPALSVSSCLYLGACPELPRRGLRLRKARGRAPGRCQSSMAGVVLVYTLCVCLCHVCVALATRASFVFIRKLTFGAYDRSTRQIIAHGDGLSARALEASDAAARCDGRIAPGPSPPPRSPGWLPLRRRSCSRRRTVSAVPFAAARGAL
jgi:hypothetical protein